MTYQYCLQPVQGPDNWPISEMPRPLPPAYVKMAGRPKTERRREPGEAPKGTKLSRKGIKMKCSLCKKSTHNARKCPLNAEVGKKKNAYIKRDAARQKKESEASNSAAATNNPWQGSASGANKRKQNNPIVSSVVISKVKLQLKLTVTNINISFAV